MYLLASQRAKLIAQSQGKIGACKVGLDRDRKRQGKREVQIAKAIYKETGLNPDNNRGSTCLIYIFDEESNVSEIEPVLEKLAINETSSNDAPSLLIAQEFIVSDMEPRSIEVEPIEIKTIEFSNPLSCKLYKRFLSNVKLQLAQEDNLIKENNSTDTIKSWIEGLDVVKHIYEGGFKTWESAVDLSTYLLEQNSDLFNQKRIIELGCGSALPSLTILKSFQPKTMHFSDYNKEVIRLATVPNVLANLSRNFNLSEATAEIEFDIEESDISGLSTEQFRFFYGDWDSLPQAINDKETSGYDVLLTTETLYTPELIPKLYNNLLKLLAKPHGVAFVASKTVYFGCGGGTLQFKSLVEADDKLTCEVGWSIKTGIAREILVLRWK